MSAVDVANVQKLSFLSPELDFLKFVRSQEIYTWEHLGLQE